MAKIYILDTSAIASGNYFLASADARNFAIPFAVLAEIHRTVRPRSLREASLATIHRLVQRGAAFVGERVSTAPDWYDGWLVGRKMRRNDARQNILAFLDTAQANPENEIVVMSMDDKLQKLLLQRSVGRRIEFMDPRLMEDYPTRRMDYDSWASLTAVKNAKQNRDTTTVVKSFFLAVAALSAFYIAGRNIDVITTVLFPWGILIALPLLGAGVFAWRQWSRLSYGIFELMVGVVTAFRVFAGETPDLGNLASTDYLQIVAGIYVIVRGMDNIGKGLERSKLRPVWKFLFRD